MITRFYKALATLLVCLSLLFGAGCAEVDNIKKGTKERNDERNAQLDRNLCKEYGHGRKTKESTTWRQVCADGAVYKWKMKKFREAWYRVKEGKKKQ